MFNEDMMTLVQVEKASGRCSILTMIDFHTYQDCLIALFFLQCSIRVVLLLYNGLILDGSFLDLPNANPMQKATSAMAYTLP